MNSTDDLGRPDSPASFMTNVTTATSTGGRSKSRSWFKRLGSSKGVEEERRPVQEERRVVEKRTMGPPPPKLPELKAGIPEEGMGAEDMFRDIK